MLTFYIAIVKHAMCKLSIEPSEQEYPQKLSLLCHIYYFVWTDCLQKYCHHRGPWNKSTYEIKTTTFTSLKNWS